MKAFASSSSLGGIPIKSSSVRMSPRTDPGAKSTQSSIPHGSLPGIMLYFPYE
ncbi:hypothetical protein GCWU000341_00035 [Oribacterium sp. oral taxon 078 str. F0262]|nr:hypothetical protein GCWU000341_00035 [Oribacterium sp. oral taxon 078 str. F0262]